MAKYTQINSRTNGGKREAVKYTRKSGKMAAKMEKVLGVSKKEARAETKAAIKKVKSQFK